MIAWINFISMVIGGVLMTVFYLMSVAPRRAGKEDRSPSLSTLRHLPHDRDDFHVHHRGKLYSISLVSASLRPFPANFPVAVLGVDRNCYGDRHSQLLPGDPQLYGCEKGSFSA